VRGVRHRSAEKAEPGRSTTRTHKGAACRACPCSNASKGQPSPLVSLVGLAFYGGAMSAHGALPEYLIAEPHTRLRYAAGQSANSSPSHHLL
jgi:hypothetical protein